MTIRKFPQLVGVQGLSIFVSPDRVSAAAAAIEAARELVPVEYQVDDIAVLSPVDGSWKIDDLRQQLNRQEALAPLGPVRVLVVEQVDLMSSKLLDSLLKTVEEPVSPTLFIFTARSVTVLPATITGRAACIMDVPGRTLGEVQQMFSGVEEQLSYYGGVFVLKSAALAQLPTEKLGESVALLNQVVGVLGEPAGAARAYRVSVLIDQLGELVSGRKLSHQVTRGVCKQLVGDFLEVVAAYQVQAMGEGVVGAVAGFERAVDGQGMLGINIPREQVLLYVLGFES